MERSVQDNCGVFGLYTNGTCPDKIYQGIDLLQYRGQKYCGTATFDGMQATC